MTSTFFERLWEDFDEELQHYIETYIYILLYGDGRRDDEDVDWEEHDNHEYYQGVM